MTAPEAQVFGGALDRPGSFLAQLRDAQTGRYLAPRSNVPGIERARADGLTGEGMLIAVVDTGVWHEHPWVHAALERSVDLTGEGEDDQNGHGTVVALIGLATAPRARLLSVKALNRRGRGTKARLVEAIEQACALGAMAANVSAGVYQPDCRGDCDLCTAAKLANESGTLVLAAAGNRAGETACPAKLALFSPSGLAAVAAYNLEAGRIVPTSGIGNVASDVGTFELRPVEPSQTPWD
jgi:subtilisin family serine protease